MKQFPYILLTLLFLAGCRGDKHLFTLDGRLEGMTDSMAWVLLTDTAFARIDTVHIKDASFTYTLTTDTVTPITLFFADGRNYTLFADKQVKSKLHGNFSALDEAEVSGGQANQEWMQFRRANRMTAPGDMADSVRRFIDRHPFSPVGPYLVNRYFAQTPQPDAKVIEELITHMGGKLLDNLTVQDLQKHLENISKADSGKYISSFRVKGIDDKFVSSYRYNNQYIVVSFWASWHAESRQEQKAVRRLAKDLKKEKLTFINISLDSDKQMWKDAVEKDTLPELQCCDPEGWNAKTTQQFAVNRLPQFILLNKNKRVIARSTRLADIETTLKACLKEDKEKK